MSCLAYTPRRSANSLAKVGAAASFAFALSLTVSQQAMAACTFTNSATVVYTCTDEDAEILNDITREFAAASSPNMMVFIDGDTELENSKILIGSITGTPNPLTTARSAAQLFGIRAHEDDDVEELKIENSGKIQLTHNGTGLVAGIAALNGAADDSFVVENEGLIEVTRGLQTIINSAATFTAVPDGTALTGVRPAVAAGIYVNEEETYQTHIENKGEIEAHGQYAYGIFGRPTALEIVNEEGATISASGTTADGAAAIVSWDGRAREAVDADNNRLITYGKTFIDNYGTITGNIVNIESSSDNNTLDFIRAIARGADPFTVTAATTPLDRRDSEINNYNLITGNLYLFAGANTVKNAEDALIDGSIIVDQRRSVQYTTNNTTSSPYNPIVGIASRFTGGEEGEEEDDAGEEALSDQYYKSFADLIADNPDHYFVLDNAGEITGDVTILTYSHIAGLPAFASETPSKVDILPHIIGAGSLDPDAPSDQSGHIDGTLAVGTTTTWPTVDNSTLATTTTITPVIDHVVHTGEWWLVAQTLFQNNPDDLPEIEDDSFLVDWERAVNTNGSLVVGSTVKDASEVENLSAPGIAALNGLLATDGTEDAVNELAVGVLRLEDEGDVRKAGEQLAPETNFATQQAALTLAFLTGQHIDNRLSGVGATERHDRVRSAVGPRHDASPASARWPHEPGRLRR